jgi:two-component system NtrC family sensor kinase
MRTATMWVFIGLTLAGMGVALIVAYFIAYRIVKPIRQLVSASERLAHGDLSHRVHLKSRDAIGKLGDTFNFMAESLKERDDQLKERAQKTIEESERLATVGQLAAGVAHELNNPLGSVLIYSHLILEGLDETDPRKDNLEKIVKQATRCKKIVQGLLDFSRQTEPEMNFANINELLNGALNLVENQVIFQNIKIIKDLMSSPPPVLVDSSQIQQVFINITLNAAEAMNGQGKLTIVTRESQDGHHIEIGITDTGCGISEENMKRLFEPFYTTKEVGRGTGLGLAISYGIVQRNNGTIQVKSHVGEGTTFTIRLPIGKRDTEHTESASTGGEIGMKTEH